MDQLRWTIAGLGVVIIVLIYLWGMRTRIREELRRRRRAQQAQNEPFLELPEESQASTPEDAGGYGFDKFSSITPDHPLADQVLVDVEITPVQRPSGQAAHDATPEDQQPGERQEVEQENAASVADEFFATNAEATNPEPADVMDIVDDDDVPRSSPEPTLKDAEWDELTPEPSLNPPEAAETDEAQPLGRTNNSSRQEPDLQEPLQMTVLLTVLATRESTFSGADILAMMQKMDLKFHKSGVLDCFSEQASGNKPVFSIAHLREPGVFELDTIEALKTPGLLLFMHLPGPLEPSEALNFMLGHGHQLAEELGGHVCDEHHNRLTNQHMGHLQGKISEFERQLRLHQPRY